MIRNHTYHELNYHLVFVTKYREKWITHKILAQLRTFFSKKAQEKSFLIHIVNGYKDHVHLLISIPPKLSISEVVKSLKGYSSKQLGENYIWNVGYAAFTVDKSSFHRVAVYIEKQEEHHSSKTAIPSEEFP